MNETASSKTTAFRNRIFKAILHGNYAPGDRLPAEREMAEANRISRITVRRACEELEQAGILERRRGSGTFVAVHRAANRNAGNVVALLSSVGDLFTLDFIRAMEKELTAHGSLMVLRLTDDSPELEEAAAIDLVGNGVRNLVVWPSGENFRGETFARLRVLGANLVFFDRMIPGDYADYVGLDNADALARLFRRAGVLQRPLFVRHSDLAPDSDLARERAFQAECAQRGLEPAVLTLPRRGKLELPGLHGYDAIFAVNDEMALRLLPAAGNTPVFGIDGLSNRIVSCRQPMAQFAQCVVKLLFRQCAAAEQWRASKTLLKGELCEPLS